MQALNTSYHCYSARYLRFLRLDLTQANRYMVVMGEKVESKQAEERAERLAKALRENLHRRKAQSRQRKTVEPESPKSKGPSSDT